MIFIDRLFIAEVVKQLKIKGWKQADLAEATGTKLTYIKAFMSGKRYNENVKKAIAEALGIEI